jgi:riboflavin kinase / FMN adenylyltransferase
MRFVESLAELTPDRPTLLTIGKFDGVHRAHQHLIATLVDGARERGAQSAVLTFDPHPDEVLHPERGIRYLTTVPERAALIAELGVDLMVALPFTAAVARWSAEEFMRFLRAHLALRELWVGPDFRLGHKAQGTIEVLRALGQTLGYAVHPIPLWTLDGEMVRSTSIRDALAAGQVDDARRQLGRPFSLQAEVVPGDQRGRTIGFPTANLAVPASHVLPADGVYACQVALLDADDPAARHPAVTNIGVRPTFGTLGRTVETHLLAGGRDLYGQTIRVEFLARLRGEQRFAGVEQLVAQIQQDVARAKLVLDS